MKFKEYINEKTNKKEFNDALKNTNILAGCEFEFYVYSTDYDNDEETSAINDVDADVLMELNFPIDLDNSDWEVTDDSSLTTRNNGVEVVTPPLKLPELINNIEKIFKWMNNNALTDDTCGFHVHMSINNDKELDPLKLLLFAEEGLVYKFFEDRRDNLYASSIRVGHFNTMGPFTADDIQKVAKKFGIDKELNTEKYLGIHLIDLKRNHVEFRYMGGRNYHKKFKEIKTLIANYAHWLSIASDPDYKRKEYITKMARLVNYFNYSYLYNIVDYYNRKTKHDYIDYIKDPNKKKIAIKISDKIIKPYISKLNSIPKVVEHPPLKISDILTAGGIASDLFNEFKKEMSKQLEK